MYVVKQTLKLLISSPTLATAVSGSWLSPSLQGTRLCSTRNTFQDARGGVYWTGLNSGSREEEQVDFLRCRFLILSSFLGASNIACTNRDSFGLAQK